MPRAHNRLTHKQVTALKAPGWHADGGGLYLRIQAGGGRSWVLVDTKGGKRKERGLGSAAVSGGVSLAEARKLRDAPPEKSEAPTFGDFSKDLIDGLEGGWKNEKHRQQWRNSLRDHAASLKDMRVDAITTDHVEAVLRPIWTKVPETASRVRSRIERILSAAKAKGLRSGENPAMWRGHLDQILPKPKTLTRGHHAAMEYTALPAFMVDLHSRPATAARALEFLILGASRTGEVLGARHEEVDSESKFWIVPANRMKAGKSHTVTLVDRQIEILNEMMPNGQRDGAYVFPGQKADKPLSNMAMEMLLRRMGIDEVTVHGFRSAFKDWASNETEYADEISEEALAHIVGSKVRRAYRRGEALDRRRRLMVEWEAFCMSGKEEAA